MASLRDIIFVSLLGVATAVVGGIGLYNHYTKKEPAIEAKANEPKQFIIDKGMDLPAELHLNRNAAVVGNQVYSEVTAAYRDELTKRGMKELGDKQRYQIYGKCIDDTIEYPDDAGEPTDTEARIAWNTILRIKKTSKTRNEEIERIKLAFPLDFDEPVIEKEQEQVGGYERSKYGNRNQPGKPSGQLSDPATWKWMYRR